jgi:hypothetical protein
VGPKKELLTNLDALSLVPKSPVIFLSSSSSSKIPKSPPTATTTNASLSSSYIACAGVPMQRIILNILF